MSALLLVSWVCKLSLISATGIVCGWQPMPDGSASYECVVQLEPEMVEGLKHGESIPLSVDVPEHVQPIRRIRITVGKNELPKQTLANFKPWPESERKSREGVVETQFTTNNNGYNQPSPQQQVNQAYNNVQDAFARSLQNGGRAVGDAVNQATQDILPPDPGRSASDAVNRAGQQLGNNLQQVGESVQSDIRQMFGSEPASSEILPPSDSPSAASNNNSQEILPAETSAVNDGRRRLDQPITANQNSEWQSTANDGTGLPAGVSNNSQRGVFNAPWPDTNTTASNSSPTNSGSLTGDRYGTAPSFSQSNPQNVPQNNQPFNTGAGFANNQPQNNSMATADARTQAGNSGGLTFPPLNIPTAGNDNSVITPTPVSQNSSAPEVRRDMLNRPANAEIQGANGLPIGQQTVSNASTQTPPISVPTNFGWDTKPQMPAASTQTASTNAAPLNSMPLNSAPASVFPLLLSWVLLSGSGAGNLYLFWSYLDVRTKYRDLVDEASRRISGRRHRD
jgi:hypothetical protein